MKKITKKVLLALPLVGMSLGLFACKPDNRTHITFWHTMGKELQDILNRVIGEFNKENPDIVVEHAQQGGYDDLETKLNDAIPAGTTPTMAYCYPDHVAEYMQSNIVVDLSTYVNDPELGFNEQDGLVEDFIDAYWAEGQEYKVKGIYSVPHCKSTEMVFYNKDVFDENGYTIPSTWEELEDLFEEMKADYPDKICLGYDSDANLFITLCEQYGIPYTSLKNGVASCDFNNAAAKLMVSKLVEWYRLGYITTQGTSNGSYTSTQFTEGTLLMTVGSTGGTKYNYTSNFNIGVSEVFKPSDDESVRFNFGGTLGISNRVIMQGPSICMFKNSTEAQRVAAWKFYKFLVKVDSGLSVSFENGYSPVRKSSFTSPTYVNYMANQLDGEKGLVQNVIRQYDNLSKRYYISPAFHGSSTCRSAVNGIFANVALETKSLDQAFADAYTQALFAME